MISLWSINFAPTERHPDRYRLQLKCSMEDAEEVYSFLKSEIRLEVSPIFQIVQGEYNWEIYIYHLSEEIKNKIIEKMNSLCSTSDDITAKNKKEIFPSELDSILKNIAEEISSKITNLEKTDKKYNGDNKKIIFESIPLNPRYKFENFVVGNNNRFTHAAALAVAENPGKTYNPLFIYGGVGLGKTHLMQSIGHYVKEKYSKKIIYITADKFVAQVIEAIRTGTIQQLREVYSNIDVLLVDDVQFMAESESTQEEFFHIFNTLHQMDKQIVITSDRPPKMLTTLEDRLKSRFEWGLIADIKSPSLETRVAILKKKGEEENVNIDDNILLYIASKLKSNVRELEGFLKRITAYSTLTKQNIDINLVKKLISELLPEEELTEEEKKLAKEEVVESISATKESRRVQPKIQIFSVQPDHISPAQQEIRLSITSDENLTKKSAQVQEKKSEDKISEEIVIDDTKFYEGYEEKLQTVETGFFYPEGKVQEIILVKQKFAEVIKKHNLKYKIKTIFDKAYNLENIDYHIFVQMCKSKNVNVSIMLSPPPESGVSSEDFFNNVSPLMESADIVVEYIPWKEMNKEYKYLNLALDIALSKFKITL